MASFSRRHEAGAGKVPKNARQQTQISFFTNLLEDLLTEDQCKEHSGKSK